MPKKFDICKFNSLLNDSGQTTMAIKISTTEIVLSNGLTLTSKKDIHNCKKRIMFGDKVWRENFDKVYSLNIIERQNAEKNCKSIIRSIGGKNCQNKHGNKIRLNLNKGDPWNKGTKGNYPYSRLQTSKTKEKISIANKGKNNGMFGRKMSAEEKQKKSNLMKERILAGKFTPNSNNRNTHWDAYYKNKKYRSSWEALYQYHDQEAKYELLRIPYYYENQTHIYIIDFVNHNTRHAIEVKPKELLNDQKTQAKILAAKEWCKKNNYNLIIADQDYFLSLPKIENLNDFDFSTQEKIRKLYETH